jgi:pilus assembly protein Flp/PilA
VLNWYEFAAQWLRSKAGAERGASLVEYALLLTLIAVMCIAALGFLGNELSQSFDSTATSVDSPN